MCLGTNVCGHKHVWAKTCLSTNVPGHKRVWTQTCLGTNVWAQTCLDTIVWAQVCMFTNVWSPQGLALLIRPLCHKQPGCGFASRCRSFIPLCLYIACVIFIFCRLCHSVYLPSIIILYIYRTFPCQVYPIFPCTSTIVPAISPTHHQTTKFS